MQTLLWSSATALTLAFASGCKGHESANSTAKTTAANESGVVRTPAQALESFLALSIITRKPTLTSMDSVFASSWGESDSSTVNETLVDNWESTRWLADYRVLQVVRDTLVTDNYIGTVAITTVASVSGQVAPVSKGVGVLEIREDTVKWRIARGVLSQGQWKVLGATLTEDWFGLGMGPTVVEWKPAGASTERAFAIVDSIRQTRGLPLVR